MTFSPQPPPPPFLPHGTGWVAMSTYARQFMVDSISTLQLLGLHLPHTPCPARWDWMGSSGA
eukprot:1146374-Pelagomonas_calceolata.AAC.4